MSKDNETDIKILPHKYVNLTFLCHQWNGKFMAWIAETNKQKTPDIWDTL